MTSYPYIKSLFTAILQQSKSIEGRFYVCPRGGSEINYDDLGQVIKANTERLTKKYPLCLMMPPRNMADYLDTKGEWVPYMITLFFLKTSYYGADANINPYTNTSQHSIEDDWYEMQTVAKEFMQVLDKVQSRNRPQLSFIPKGARPITPVSEIGIDRASGVSIDFEIKLFEGCEDLTDYEDISLITIPV